MQKKQKKTTDFLVREIFDSVRLPVTKGRIVEFLDEQPFEPVIQGKPEAAPVVPRKSHTGPVRSERWYHIFRKVWPLERNFTTASNGAGVWILGAGAATIFCVGVYFTGLAAEKQVLLDQTEAALRQKKDEVLGRRGDLALNQSQAASLSRSLADLSKKRSLAVNHVQFLEKNVRSQAEWSDALSALGRAEHESVRLTEFSVKNGRFSASGVAMDQMGLLRLVDILNRSTYFKGANIASIESGRTSFGDRVYLFRINARAIF